MFKQMIMRMLGYTWEENVIRKGKLYNITRWRNREVQAVEVLVEHVFSGEPEVPTAAVKTAPKRERVRSLFDKSRSGQIKVNITKQSEFM